MSWTCRSARLLAFCAALSGCSPVLDWRELRPEGSSITVMFPCKPDRHARQVVLAGRPVSMDLLVCSAGGTTFALSFANLGDPTAMTPALAELRAAAIGNVAGTVTGERALQVGGMTPHPGAARLDIAGRRPDGVAVQEHVAVFVHGLRVYQASLLGPALAPEAVETFVSGLRLGS